MVEIRKTNTSGLLMNLMILMGISVLGYIISELCGSN